MDDYSVLLAFIQEAIRQGRFYVTHHGIAKHAAEEGFRPRQGIEAILNGQIIENREQDSRCLICGQVDDLAVSPDYIANYIHCVCEYDNIQNIVIVTMYRPHSDEWLNHFTRRR